MAAKIRSLEEDKANLLKSYDPKKHIVLEAPWANEKRDAKEVLSNGEHIK